MGLLAHFIFCTLGMEIKHLTCYTYIVKNTFPQKITQLLDFERHALAKNGRKVIQ